MHSSGRSRITQKNIPFTNPKARLKSTRSYERPSKARMSRYRAIADYYDAEYADHPMLDRDVPFFLGHLPRKSQRVLELACGTARAAIPIAQAGHRVVGVDYAPEMLEIARHKRDAVG